MNDPIRTRAEALEAAAQIADGWGWPGQMQADAYARLTVADEASRDTADAIAAAIRVLASRIAAPDDEALVEDVAEALRRINPNAPSREHARAAIAALREAGALR